MLFGSCPPDRRIGWFCRPTGQAGFTNGSRRQMQVLPRAVVRAGGPPLVKKVASLCLGGRDQHGLAPGLDAALDGLGRFTAAFAQDLAAAEDRKSTRLNSSHEWISYAVFC